MNDQITLWGLAIIPLTISIILHLLLGDIALVFIIVFIFNIIFLSYDYFKSRASHEYPLYMFILGLVFIPIYLYFRTVKDDHKIRFILVWILLYIFDLTILQMAV